MEERQPVDVAVSKDNVSIARCSPMFHTAPASPKSKSTSMIQPDTSVPGGNTPKPARPIPAAPSAHHRSKSLMPEVWDKMPRTSYPDTASCNNLSSLPLSMKMDAYKRHVAVAENKRRISSPSAWTVPTLSKPSPVHRPQACAASSSPRVDTRRRINDIVTRHRIAILPAPQRTVLSQPHAPCVEPDLQVLACLPDELLAVKMLRHSCNVVSRADKMSNPYSLALQETVPQQSRRPRAGERSKECSQAPQPSMVEFWSPCHRTWQQTEGGILWAMSTVVLTAHVLHNAYLIPWSPPCRPVQSPQSRHGLNRLMLLSCLILPIRWIHCKSQKLSVNVPTQAA
jgi:hypothetical protein